MLKRHRILATAALPMLLAGCTSIGPDVLRSGRPQYNMAVQQTNDQELLLNLVRIRYRDTLFFTAVQNFGGTQEFDQTYGASGSLGWTHNAPATGATIPGTSSLIESIFGRTLTLGPGSIGVFDRPNVIYAPIEGQKFVQQMMTPMNPDLLLLQVRSGWSLDRVFSVGVQEVNGLRNSYVIGDSPEGTPEYRDFQQVIKDLRQLQAEHKVDIANHTEKRAAPAAGNPAPAKPRDHAQAKKEPAPPPAPEVPQLELRFIHGGEATPEAQRIRDKLHLDPNRDRFAIVAAPVQQDAQTIAITTRSMIAALHFLAHGIEAPQRDVDAGKLDRDASKDSGRLSQWHDILDGVFRISSSDDEPKEASVAIFYRGAWFYIADNDLDTKSTFVLLTQLMALHSVAPPPGPVLTYSFGN